MALGRRVPDWEGQTIFGAALIGFWEKGEVPGPGRDGLCGAPEEAKDTGPRGSLTQPLGCVRRGCELKVMRMS